MYQSYILERNNRFFFTNLICFAGIGRKKPTKYHCLTNLKVYGKINKYYQNKVQLYIGGIKMLLELMS